MPLRTSEEADLEKDEKEVEGGKDSKKENDGENNAENVAAGDDSSKRKSRYRKLLESLGGDAGLEEDLRALHANLERTQMAPTGDPLSGTARQSLVRSRNGSMIMRSGAGGALTSPGKSPMYALAPSNPRSASTENVLQFQSAGASIGHSVTRPMNGDFSEKPAL